MTQFEKDRLRSAKEKADKKVPTHKFTFTEKGAFDNQFSYMDEELRKKIMEQYKQGFDMGMGDSSQFQKARQMGKSEFFRQEYEGNWQRGRNTRLDDAKLTFATQLIYEKHKIQVNVLHDTFGDYIRVQWRDRIVQISNTDMAVKDPSWLVNTIEEGLGLVRNIRNKIEGVKPTTPTEDWANDWARKQGI